MEIKGIKYTKRFNLGNYEHEEYTVDAQAEDASASDFAQLKELVAAAHAGDVKSSAKVSRANKAKEEAEEEEEEEENAPAKKTTKKKVEPEPEEDDADDEDDEDDEEEAPKAVKGKAVKKKGSVYDRNSDLHKKLFVELLNSELGDSWVKKNAGRAKTASIKMEGKNFLDADGEILADFVKEALKIAKAK